jgi:hypothetical protein
MRFLNCYHPIDHSNGDLMQNSALTYYYYISCMKPNIIFTLLLFYCINVVAVETNLPVDINSSHSKVYPRNSVPISGPLDSLFEGGSEAYFDIIRKNIRYPMNSSENKVQGSLIFSIKVNPTSGVSLEFLTKLDVDIENAVRNAIGRTADLWNKDNEYILYQTMFFSIGEEFNTKFEDKVSSFKKNYEDNWLEPTRVSTRGTAPKDKLGGKDDEAGGSGRRLGNNLKRRSSTPVVYDIDPYSEYKSALSKYNKSFKKGKSENAYEQISQVILFNPFDLKSIEARQKLALELGESDFAKYDQLLLEALKNN